MIVVALVDATISNTAAQSTPEVVATTPPATTPSTTTPSTTTPSTTTPSPSTTVAPAVLTKLGELKTGSNPKQVTFTPDGTELWVTLLGGRGVQVFSAATGAMVEQIPLGTHGGVEVIFTRDGTRAYVSQMETATVWEIDRTTRKVLRTMATQGRWTKVMVLSADEKTLYAANWVSNDVSEIDLASGKVRRRIPTVRTPRGLALTPDGTRLFVAGFDGGELQSIYLGTGKGPIVLRTGGAMRHLVVDTATNRLFADDMAEDATFVVDLATNIAKPFRATDSHPNSMDLTPDGRILFVSNRGRNGDSYYNPGPEWGSVMAIDSTTGQLLDAVIGGNQPTGLDVSPDGRVLAFTDFLDNRVELYSIPGYDDLLAAKSPRAATYRAQLTKVTPKAKAKKAG